MRDFMYKKIDAFTSGNSLGNPAAYLYLGKDTLTSDEMLFVGKQHKGFVSEVVFGEETEKADIKLTYYSSECEVEFCGHGTIATMHAVIKNSHELRQKKEILIETNRKGILKVYNRLDQEDAVYITAPDVTFIGTELSSEDIAKALEIPTGIISERYPIDFVNAGLRTLLVPIEKLEDEISIFPTEVKLKEFCLENEIDIILLFCFQTSSSENYVHSRVFAPRFGYLEDPATGSGNSALGYYMRKNALWEGAPIAIEQGGNDRVFNIVRLFMQDERVLFGGKARTCIDGVYHME